MHTYLAAGGSLNTAQAFAAVIGVVAAVAFYWLPTIIAAWRKVPNTGSVAVINFFAFAMLIPWVIALAMAVRTVPPRESVTR